MYSTPNSPLARIIETDTHSIHELMYGNHAANDNDDDNDTNTFPNHALVSDLATQFVAQVKSVTKRRKIFTTAEYPSSFNGEEAVVSEKKGMHQGINRTKISVELEHCQVHSTVRVAIFLLLKSDPGIDAYLSSCHLSYHLLRKIRPAQHPVPNKP
jgi:hypothetical protein